MNWKELVKKNLEERKNKILKSIASANDARENAPSAMESHSDTSRNQNEKLIFALKIDLANLEEVTKQIDNFDVKYFEIKQGSSILKVVIVPEGAGGEQINGVKIISIKTPLGEILKDKNLGDKFIINDRENEIANVSL
jgi:transcription elongation GreA/GreB family factor